MSLLLPETGLIFWMILVFGIVLGILWKYGFPVITKMVNDRKEYIDSSLKEAREVNAQLARIKEEGEAIVLNANKEQGRILKEAMQERERIISEARSQADAITRSQVEEAKKQIQAEKDDAIRDIRREVAALSVDIAEKVIRKNLDTNEEQMQMIDRMLNEVLEQKN
jgi:F-type H+-transporting ATPase subunit b